MSKNFLIPLTIILGGALIGGVLLFSGGSNNNSIGADVTQANLRKADLEIKNMFCVGCRSSVVNSVMGLSGVVQADADPRTDSGWVIYDPEKSARSRLLPLPFSKRIRQKF
ncbi:MAG: hypothetical protein COU81_00945 [Candidatus Portnoybacteria bacterium CG10_big_fil_rev_8_21_14_0_10_36_7]|uniref:HMA domain-containing protein n=1 Tax=Candidatus Portnoybacteria bacterium CG10_big_fil_rev_8_21_14_0_10_36_7 TaxID=1974812 RepID=A0A2M8KEP6_9BACT|nr:MAG: hypothetical protein COU81_00945 [Candidatus Portnoybacteria bacterium CG10_big_fil_rev_8_21_14_0_10_36_7]